MLGPVQIEMHPISRYGTGNSVASSATNQPIGAEIFIPDDVEAAENLTETVKVRLKGCCCCCKHPQLH